MSIYPSFHPTRPETGKNKPTYLPTDTLKPHCHSLIFLSPQMYFNRQISMKRKLILVINQPIHSKKSNSLLCTRCCFRDTPVTETWRPSSRYSQCREKPTNRPSQLRADRTDREVNTGDTGPHRPHCTWSQWAAGLRKVAGEVFSEKDEI